jgi:hypothetical protein
MIAGQKYYVRFFVSLADYSEYAVENIGIHFFRARHPALYPINELGQFEGQVYQIYSQGQLVGYPVMPQVINTNGPILDSQNWVEIRGEYIAVGNEDRFVVANFSTRNDPSAVFLGNNSCGEGTAFYYIDDISVSTQPFEVTISATSCGINGYTLTASDGFSSYLWSNGQTGQTITVPNPSSLTNYQVIASNPSFDCPNFSATISLKPIINPNSSILGTEFACNNNGTNIFSASNFNPLSTYNWSVSNGAIGNIIGQNQYQVVFSNLVNDYTINLEVTNNEGCVFYYSHIVKGCCGNINLSCVGFDEGPLFTSVPNLIYKVNYTASQLIAENNGNPVITGSPSSNPVMVFQGDLIIDTDITFQSGRFLFGKETGIIIQSGNKFTSNNSFLLPCDCNGEMWNGIVLESNTSELTMNTTRVFQAKAAVTSNHGAKYNISGSVFRNCYNGLVVNSFNGNHVGVITNTRITSVTGQLIAPYASVNSKTRNGVLINDVNNINIGNVNTLPQPNFGGVSVENAFNGVFITNSNVTIKNSFFIDCFGNSANTGLFTEGNGVFSHSTDAVISVCFPFLVQC